MKPLKLLALGVAGMSASAIGQMTVMNAATVDKVSDILVKNGTVARPVEYREAVLVEFRRGASQSICSGVLVAPGAVLTAAHCGYNGVVPVRVSAASRLDQALDLGSDGYARSPATGSPDVQSVGVLSYAFMDAASVAQGRNLAGRDVMVIRLKKDLVAPAVPIAISSLDGISNAQYVRVVGFGKDGKNGLGKKLFADINVIASRCGAASAAAAPDCEPDDEMFARHPQGNFDTCPGDSGGPVYVRSQFAQYRLVGLTSRATGPSTQCGGGTVVTLLDGERLSWVRSQVSISVSAQALKPEVPVCGPPIC